MVLRRLGKRHPGRDPQRAEKTAGCSRRSAARADPARARLIKFQSVRGVTGISGDGRNETWDGAVDLTPAGASPPETASRLAAWTPRNLARQQGRPASPRRPGAKPPSVVKPAPKKPDAQSPRALTTKVAAQKKEALRWPSCRSRCESRPGVKKPALPKKAAAPKTRRFAMKPGPARPEAPAEFRGRTTVRWEIGRLIAQRPRLCRSAPGA